MRASLWLIPASALAVAPAQAMVYLSVEQAQVLMFPPHAALTAAFVTLTPAQMQAIVLLRLQ